jgi:hypothetical protein
MASQNDNPFATSWRADDKLTALSLMKIQLGYFASVVACFAIAFLVAGFEFAGVVVLVVVMGPLLSLVETVHGIYKAIFLSCWWGTGTEFTIFAMCLCVLSWTSFVLGCRAMRCPKRRISLLVSHVLFVAYWAGTIYLVHLVRTAFFRGLVS